MTRTRIAVIAAGAAAAVAGLTWAIAAPARHDAGPGVAAPAPTDSTWPLYVGPSSSSPSGPVPAPPSAASSSVAPATRAETTAPATAVAEPFVQSFANQPGVKPLKPLPSPKSTFSVAANVDGCDHAYGLPTQCIPWTFPPGTTDKCAWLAAHGFTKLPVVAADRQKLDLDGDRIACD